VDQSHLHTKPFQGEFPLWDREPQGVALGCHIAALQADVDAVQLPPHFIIPICQRTAVRRPKRFSRMQKSVE
jgi:hypothetical protein